MKKILLFFFLFRGINILALAPMESIAGDSSTVSTSKIDELPIPSRDSLYKWADENSSSMRIQDALVEKTDADTKRIKKNWLDAVKFSANIRTGSYGNTVINQTETGYSLGPAVSFSIYELASRRNLIDVYKSEAKAATWKREEVRFELHKIIIVLCNNIQSQKNILQIRSEAVNAAYVHMKMAEKEFNQGNVQLGELSRVGEIYAKAQTDREETINVLKNYYMELEQLCGKTFN